MVQTTATPRRRAITDFVIGSPDMEDAFSWRAHIAARNFRLVIGAGVILIFILSCPAALRLPAIPAFILAYVLYALSKEILRARLGHSYYRPALQILRAQGIILATTVLLAFLHSQQQPDQYLWLYYILAALVVSEHCETHWLFATLVEIVALLFALAIFLPNVNEPELWQQAVSRALWIGVLSFVVHYLMRNVEMREKMMREQIAAQQRAATQLKALWQVGQTITSMLDQDVLLKVIAEIVHDSFGYDRVHVLLVDEKAKQLIFKAGTDLAGHALAEQEFRMPLERGITSWVATTGESVLANDVQADPHYYRHDLLSRVRAELAVPIIYNEQVLGVLDVESDKPDVFGEEDERTLRVLADQIALALNNAASYARSQRHAAEMDAYYRAGLTTAAARDLDEALNLIYEEVVRFLQVKTFYIALWNRPQEEIRFELLVDAGTRVEPFSRRLVPGRGLTEYILQTGKPLLLHTMEEADVLPVQALQVGSRCASYAGVPLIACDQVLGVIAMQSEEPAAFNETHLEALEKLARQAALVIDGVMRREGAVAEERARLSRELHDSVTQYVSSIKLMAETAAIQVQTDPAQAQERMGRIQDVAQTALNEIRLHIHDLRLPSLRDDRFLGIVTEYVRLLRDYYHLDVDLTVSGTPRIGQQAGEQLYHVLQEALHNVAKHAQAQHVSVSLTFSGATADLVVQDDGRGFDMAALAKHEQKQGLLNMEYRVKQLGGRLQVDSTPGAGTRISVSVALPPPGAAAGGANGDNHAQSNHEDGASRTNMVEERDA